MATIRPASPVPPTPRLENVTITDMPAASQAFPRTLSADRSTIYAVRSRSLIQSTNDGKTWTLIKDFGTMPNGGSGNLACAVLLPNGEMMVSDKVGGGKGTLFISNGFKQDTPTTATWSTAKLTDGSTLRVSRNDNRIHDTWGYSVAPAGHVREGLVVVTEYGGQSSASDADALSPKIWLSFDYGKTFKVLADLFTLVGSRVNQHMHGILYDPYFDVILGTYGDGNGSGAKTGLFQITDFESASPKITHVYQTNTANFQATTMFACEGGILLGSDGAPNGLYRLPRRDFRVWGKLQTVLNYGAGTGAGLIGQRIHQNGPGAPILISSQWNKSEVGTSQPLWLSFNGEEFYELYRDGTAAMNWPNLEAVGPTRSGKVCMTITGDNRTSNNCSWITGDLIIP